MPGPLEPLTRVNVPKTFNSRNPAARRDLASTLRNVLGATDSHVGKEFAGALERRTRRQS